MNLNVRTVEGHDGPIILAAHCPTCQQEAMPMRDGTCGWCDTLIVGEPGTPAPEPKVFKLHTPRGPNIPTDDIVEELQRFAAQLGRAPYSKEWYVSGRKPSRKTIYRRFGNWQAALEAAGLE